MPTLVTRGAASVRGFGFAGTTPVLADPYFNYTTLLLHGNGTNGGQNNTFLDSGTANSGSGFTITRNGNTTQGTFSPFSQTGWSNYFDGSGDYLNTTSSANLNLGASNFTVEFWVNPSALTNEARMVTVEVTSSTTVGIIMGGGGAGGSNTDIQVNQFGTGTRISAASVLSVGSWFHVAVTYNGTTSTLWVNGISKGTYSGNVYPNSNSYVTIGGSINYSNATFNGYLSNVRVLKGTCLYTTTFTPPTAPLTAITDTQLLTCQSNRFIDNSANQFTITVSGNTSVQAFSPFAPTAAYSASTVGGSGYFDGSGDYLSVANNTALQLGSSDWDIECWVYLTTTISGAQRIISQADSNYEFAYYLSNMALTAYSFQSGGTQNFAISMGTLTTGQWYHLATTRSGSNIRSFINGTQVGTATFSGTIDARTGGWNFGASYAPSEYLNGYISSARIVKGSAVYTSAFTPPTAPLTNITNTSLLLNFTNAAIIDNTAKNVLETVGNAQISTTQSKFGGASLYFDGTGDYLQNRLNDITNFGAGDFTMECWIYPTTSATLRSIVDTRGTDINAAYGWFLSASDKLDFLYKSSSPFRLTSTSSVSTNVWTHVVVCRASGTLRLFINGTVDGSATVTDSLNGVAGTRIGGGYADGSGNPGFYLTGYIDDLRITKGIARYTSNFTPQTSQWQDQ